LLAVVVAVVTKAAVVELVVFLINLVLCMEYLQAQLLSEEEEQVLLPQPELN
tara:strand:+ start:122 stop:277 length:156 start_codon:yes stop_codon:yes gene_type:complete